MHILTALYGPTAPPTLLAQPARIAAARSAHDKLAWAVHAFLLAEGFKLVATGAAAEDEGAGTAASNLGRISACLSAACRQCCQAP